MLVRSLVSAGALLAAFALAVPAAANGRFPQSQQLVEFPSNPDRLILRTTFGVLRSVDAGRTWQIICEESVGYGGTEDPAVGVTADGTIIAGMFSGLGVSHDLGCQFDFVKSGLDARFVIDVTVEKEDPTSSLALISEGLGGGRFLNQVWQSPDNGVTWTQAGANLEENMLGLTLDPAPSDPSRIYVTSQAIGGGAIFRSSDRGVSWESFPVPGTGSDASSFIGAVHPTDADRVFVRVSGFRTSNDGVAADDVLLVTNDAGESWVEVHRAGGKMLGFALSPDGAEVLIGYGNPLDGTVVDSAALGLWRASTSDFVFEKIFDGSITCAAWTPAGVYVCSSEFSVGFELGFAPSPSFTLADAAPFTILMNLRDAEGVVDCPAGTSSGDRCPSRWPELCELIARCAADGGTADAGAATEAGQGGGGAGASDAGRAVIRARGASCRSTPSGHAGGSVAGLVLLLLAGGARRRRPQSLARSKL